MLDFVLKHADFHDTVSICSLPVSKEGHTGMMMASHVQTVLEAVASNSSIGTICLAYDNATNFALVNKVLLGRSLLESLKSDRFLRDAHLSNSRPKNMFALELSRFDAPMPASGRVSLVVTTLPTP